MHRTLSATLLVVALAAAEDSPTIIVTAERGESDLAKSPFVTEVVTSEDIVDRGYVTNGADWLRGLSGVHVLNRNGGVDGGIADVRVRGVDPVFTQVLIDGLPLNDPSSIGGDLNPSFINPAGIRTVEVLKGAQSGLYGSRAIGGVINYLSVRPTAEAHAGIRAMGGSFDTAGFEATATGPISATTGYAVAISGLSSGGFSAKTDQDPGTDGDPRSYERDGLHRLSLSARFEARPTQGTFLYAAVFAQQAEQELDELDQHDALATSDMQTQRVLTGAKQTLGVATISADVGYTTVERVNHTNFGPPPTFAPDVSTYEGNELYSQVRIEYRPIATVRLTAGVDDRVEEAQQSYQVGAGSWSDQARTVGTYVQASWEGERASASLVGRLDEHSEYGTVGTGRAAIAAWPVAQTLKVRGSLANGFRSPSLYQLHGFEDFGSGSGYTGNPDLGPERALTYELGSDWYPAPGIEVGATVFRTEYRDKITYDSAAAVGTYHNLSSDARVEGAEFALRGSDLAAVGIDVEVHATVLRNSDGAGNDLAYTPAAFGGCRVTAHQQGGRSAFWQSIGFQRSTGFATGANGGNVVPGYHLVDAAVGMAITKHWEVSVRIENAFDQQYLLTSSFGADYSTSPRALYANLTATF